MGITCDGEDSLLIAFAQMSSTLNNPVGKLLKLVKGPGDSGRDGTDLDRTCVELWSAKGVMPKGLAVSHSGLVVLTNCMFKQQLIFIDARQGTICKAKARARTRERARRQG